MSQRTMQERRFSTKARAILAGGLVLGVGAAITLAAWTDDEWAQGAFGTGTFGIEGAADGGAFDEHPDAASAAGIDFAVGADTLSPGDSVYGGFAVQLVDESDYAAEVAVSTDASGAVAGTTSSYVYTTSATCDATAYAAGTDANATSFDLTAPGTPVYLCFRVTADGTIQQGQSGEIVWHFAATSTDAL